MGKGKPEEKNERKLNKLTYCTSLSPSAHSPIKYEDSELFAKSCDNVLPCSGSPVLFVAWEKLNCFPEQVVSVQIVGVDISPFDG